MSKINYYLKMNQEFIWECLGSKKLIAFHEAKLHVYYSLIHSSIHNPEHIGNTDWRAFQKMMSGGSLTFEVVSSE